MNEEYLREQILDNLSVREIARRNNKSVTSVQYWIKKYNIKLTKYSRFSWNEDLLKKAITTSSSKREILNKLGVRDTGSSYSTLRRVANELGLVLPKSYNSGNYHKGPKKTIEDMFSVNSTTSTGTIKKYLINHFGVIYKCVLCGLKEWKKKAIVLEIDHIDGNRTNNSIDNLRLLCPNCHSQTSTYCKK